MSHIGGYMDVTGLGPKRDNYYENSVFLNSCRSAIIKVLIAKNIKHVYLPYFTCKVVIDVVEKNNLKITYYRINNKFEIIDKSILNDSSNYIIYTNYFGIKDSYIEEVSLSPCKLMIDNAQSFYSSPILTNDTVYSPRKFFPVPDGGVAITNLSFDVDDLGIQSSSALATHLLIRVDSSPQEGYQTYQENEEVLGQGFPKQMSSLSRELLTLIDYNWVKTQRLANFCVLNEGLKELNDLGFCLDQNMSGVSYPFYHIKAYQLKQFLIDQKVYVATYWPEVLDMVEEESWEYKFVKNMVSLPIDQRYSKKDMLKIIKLIKGFLNQ